jgi:hypothetical protein
VKEKDKISRVLSYIKTPLSEDSINILYASNNIDYDKCVLFSDYVQSLFALIFDTYMGDDVTTNTKDKIRHFDWCWFKNIENFKSEGIYFQDTDDTFNYFIEFMMEVFYSIDDKEDKNHLPMTIRTLWLGVFSFNKVKTRSDVENFIEVYKILDKSLKKG